MMRRIDTLAVAALLAVALAGVALHPRSAGAQRVSPSVAPRGLVAIGDETDERLRLAQLVSDSGTSGYLLRSASTLSARPQDTATRARGALRGRVRLRPVLPTLVTAYNSDIPLSVNDGALWVGRGLSVALSGGFEAEWSRVRLVVAPQRITEANLDFQVIPYPQTAAAPRSVWANPFHPAPGSIDLPLRFGAAPRRRWDAGQSSLTVRAGPTAFGVATENVWWGPGIRNGLLLSNNAAGFPHFFARTARPVETPVGSWEGHYLLGRLSESGFFDTLRANDHRSLSGVAVTFRPAGEPGLTLGLARIVVAPIARGAIPVGAAFDFVRDVGHPDSQPDTARVAAGPDQVLSLFGRWVFPAAGFEAYAEWARFEMPLSLRDFLEFPQHSQGYTLGLQWARPMGTDRTFRAHGELSYLEPDPSLRVRRVGTAYTSASVVQGFTERGQMLGAAIGPGSSSQWLAGDLFAPAWRVGAFLGRIRWDEGVLYGPLVPEFKQPDVSLFGGLRASVVFRGMRAALEATRTVRLNYLFQAYLDDPLLEKKSGIDIRNGTITLTLSPVGGR